MEDLQDLEGTLFDLSHGECLDYVGGYKTICYGLSYNYNENINYFLEYLYTEESEGKIGISRMTEGRFYKFNDDIKEININKNPGRNLIKRVFEFEWE